MTRYPSQDRQGKNETSLRLTAQALDRHKIVQQKSMTPHILRQSFSGQSLALSMDLEAGGLFALCQGPGTCPTEVKGSSHVPGMLPTFPSLPSFLPRPLSLVIPSQRFHFIYVPACQPNFPPSFYPSAGQVELSRLGRRAEAS